MSGIHQYQLLCHAFFAPLHRVAPEFRDDTADDAAAASSGDAFAEMLSAASISSIRAATDALHCAQLTHVGSEALLSTLCTDAGAAALVARIEQPLIHRGTLLLSDENRAAMSRVYDAERRAAHALLHSTRLRLLSSLLSPPAGATAPLYLAFAAECASWRSSRACPASAAERVRALTAAAPSPVATCLLATCAVAMDSNLAISAGVYRGAVRRRGDTAVMREPLADEGEVLLPTATCIRLDDAALLECMHLPAPTFALSLLAFMLAFAGMSHTHDGAVRVWMLPLQSTPHALVTCAALAALPLPARATTLWRPSPASGDYVSCLSAAALTAAGGATSTWAGMLRPRSRQMRGQERTQVPIHADVAYHSGGDVFWSARADIESGGGASLPVAVVRSCAAIAMGLQPCSAPAVAHASINSDDPITVQAVCPTHGGSCSYAPSVEHSGGTPSTDGRLKRARHAVWRCAVL